MTGLASPVPAVPGPDTSVAGSIYRHISLRSVQSASIPGLGPALYGMGGLTAFLLLAALLRLMEMLLRKLKKTPPHADPPRKPFKLPLEGTAISLPAEQPTGTHRRTGDLPVPVPEPSNPNSGQQKALHAAALMAIGSRSLRSPEVAAKRRSLDYQGPRRRSTDNRAEPVYMGPFRRTDDRSAETMPDIVSDTITDTIQDHTVAS